jgi:hypothetical protein
MHYSKGAGYNLEKQCLPNTRQTIIDEIVGWVNDPNTMSASVFWLNGVAGSGKSAIAHTVARMFDEQRRLGSCFCFDAGNQANCQPYHLFSTIARDLADLDPQWKSSLYTFIKDSAALRSSPSVKQQFEIFLLKPAASLKFVGPVVIVIDALDECGGPESRKIILQTLAKEIPKLPANFRIILTSRPEVDIVNALQDSTHILSKHMETIDKQATAQDMSIFIQSSLNDVQIDIAGWQDRLSHKAEGLFQWASTACRFIMEPGSDPSEQFQLLLSTESNNLDYLYLDILKKIFPREKTVQHHRFKAILGMILTVKEPLSIAVLCKLCWDSEAKHVWQILQPLGSLLSGIGEEEAAIQPLHTSFRDFLITESRSHHFYISPEGQDKKLVISSLQSLKSKLCFNICQLPTSYLANQNVMDLEKRIKDNIPADLSYACKFMADHLQAVEFDNLILADIDGFMRTQFLYWLEVLSLVKKIPVCFKALSILEDWCKVCICITGLQTKDLHCICTSTTIKSWQA